MSKLEKYNEQLSDALKGKYRLKGDVPGLAWEDWRYGTQKIDFRTMEPEQADLLIEKEFPYLEKISAKSEVKSDDAVEKTSAKSEVKADDAEPKDNKKK